MALESLWAEVEVQEEPRGGGTYRSGAAGGRAGTGNGGSSGTYSCSFFVCRWLITVNCVRGCIIQYVTILQSMT